MKWLLLICAASTAQADTLIAARTIRSHEILTEADVVLIEQEAEGPITNISAVVGMEARIVLYAGRPINPSDIGPAAVIERNQIVSLLYRSSGLLISTSGRALDRAGPGDDLRVMNLSSRTTLVGEAMPDGSVLITN